MSNAHNRILEKYREYRSFGADETEEQALLPIIAAVGDEIDRLDTGGTAAHPTPRPGPARSSRADVVLASVVYMLAVAFLVYAGGTLWLVSR